VQTPLAIGPNGCNQGQSREGDFTSARERSRREPAVKNEERGHSGERRDHAGCSHTPREFQLVGGHVEHSSVFRSAIAVAQPLGPAASEPVPGPTAPTGVRSCGIH
jgi:hypothetical protein